MWQACNKVRKSCAGYLVEIVILLQFLTIEPDYIRKGYAGHAEIAIIPQFLTIEPHFVRKDIKNTSNRIFTSIFDDNTSFRAKKITSNFGNRGHLQIVNLPQFLVIEPHFVRKGCVSCRLVGTVSVPAFRRETEKKERARGQEEKM